MSKSEVTTPKETKKPKKAATTEFKKIIRVAEADLDGNKKLEHGLTAIKGIGWSYANAIRKAIGFENKKIADLSGEEIAKIKDCLENPEKFGIPEWVLNRRKDRRTGSNFHLLSSSLILANNMDVKRLKIIKCYKGVRHISITKLGGREHAPAVRT